jgi:hypothetical protein
MKITIFCPKKEEILIFSQNVKTYIRNQMKETLPKEDISVFFRRGDNNAAVKIIIWAGAKIYPPCKRPEVRRNITSIFYGEKVGYPKQKIKVGVNFN